MNKTTPIGNEYLERYPEWRKSLPGTDLVWLAKMREDAFQRFAESGFPTPKTEAWKYTNLNPLAKNVFAPKTGFSETISADDLPLEAQDGLSAHHLVFINGKYAPPGPAATPLPEGVRLLSLGDALKTIPDLMAELLTENAKPEAPDLRNINTALMTEGAVLLVEPGVQLEKPVHFFFLATEEAGDAAMHLRNLVVLGKGSTATVLESYLGTGQAGYWTNVVTEIAVHDDARLHHYKFQNEAAAAYHIAATTAKIGERAVYDNFIMSLGGSLSRNDIFALLDGSGIDCRLNGVNLARNRQHMDTTSVIDHKKPGSSSSETYKNVVDDHAKTVFQGKVIVRPDSQKTSAHQLNRNLLLSDDASANAKPELRIHADDVKCSHGATIGELDEQALFYFCSRGISENIARSLLTESFLAELVDAVEIPAIREKMRQAITAWLAQAGPIGGRP
ncbi:MAG: Fe-S cluster assembly protein SufD [Rhodospirillaceae bacterium]|nr:MAG: Fe-S cluster assembly protein SufD [Rhodospirillaceae bacterium]